MTNQRNVLGFSLIETLIVTAIFAGLAIVSTQAIIVTLTNSRKAESSVQTRESLQYALTVMERYLRSASNINAAGSGVISFVDEAGLTSTFTCVNASSGSTAGYLRLNSNRISSNDITLTNCSFSSVSGTSDIPDRVMISVTGQAKNLTGIEQTPITVSTIVYLRVY